MKILVATTDGQGGRVDDYCEADEGEIVVPALTCDQLHDGCMCNRVMVGVHTGKETTTAIVVQSDMTREAYRRAIREAVPNQAIADMKVPLTIFDSQADAMLQLASELPAGVVIERDRDDFNPRVLSAVADS